MDKLKITLLALLAITVALAIFFAVVKIAAVLSVILLIAFAIAIIHFATKYWPRR